ncbi:TrmH family RNA methyltransferase [Lutispora sp.]|uniref:TrmH family RNA methyltransferase n=1 Tax=Lutispora sp. TaxID=2828727 RepID=UPI003561DABA
MELKSQERWKRRLIEGEHMIQAITSSQNKIIKHAKSLHMKKYRDSNEQFLIEGIKLIREALTYDVSINTLLYHNKVSNNPDIQEIINICLGRGVSVYELEEKPYLDISETKTPQGIICIGHKRTYDINLLIKRDRYNVVILEEVQDPGNVGTIIRTADAFGFDFVILSKGCADIYSGKTIRSTMGSLFHIPVIDNVDLVDVISTLNQVEVLTLATTPRGGIACYDIDYKNKNAIVIGNESKGLSDAVMDKVKIKANIPMLGKAESLNASVAASTIMYELMRYKLLTAKNDL